MPILEAHAVVHIWARGEWTLSLLLPNFKTAENDALVSGLTARSRNSFPPHPSITSSRSTWPLDKKELTQYEGRRRKMPI